MDYILTLCGPVRCLQHVWSERALHKGLECRRKALHKWLSHALKGGAGLAHRWCAKEDALPDLPLVIRDRQGVFTADPQCVAEHYTQEWKREWRCEDTFFFHQELQSIRALRETHFEDAGEWANGLDLSAVNIRTVCLSFPSQTAIGLDQHSRTLPDFRTSPCSRWEKLPGRALSNEPYKLSRFCSCWFCWARKTEVAEQSPFAHHLSSHQAFDLSTHQAQISQWVVNFAGKWDSALKGNSALRAHVARAAGIELAHSATGRKRVSD